MKDPSSLWKTGLPLQTEGSMLYIHCFDLRGWRYIEVRERRTKEDYAEFMKNVADRYPEAEIIRVLQDNLNTHTYCSFYERFEPEEAKKLCEKFEFHYTPKKASWLNMAEIEFSALSKQCLDQR
ncbi:MAG TPA: hypothetical protein ENI32_08225 [Candidatus Syntrophoarchaeum butanivorans]|uniref:Tc1-like transposase DDE domain-containing protein n=2 Tax=Candidatus Syntropharchaeum butanivorans TaxID=1839936 RepID=A0A7J2S353_9EURY|nr:hypothetical protein [Candidatus Syntrophoarchaeum butanivorans]